jgi:pyridoxamine 5'-phosphate oxidase
MSGRFPDRRTKSPFLWKEQKVRLQQLQDRGWEYLRAGAGSGRAPFTIMQAATISVTGAPAVRTVVLRRAAESESLITFHTDVRSAKVAELRADPRIALVGYDPEHMIQLRLEGVASVITDGNDKKTAWDSSREHSLVLYRTIHPPGTSIGSPDEAYAGQSNLHSTVLAGYENFCIVRVSLKTFELLDLSMPANHKRAHFIHDGFEWKGQWIAP